MTDVEKAYNAGYIAALVMAKAHHMKVVGKWDYFNPDEWVGFVSDKKLAEIKSLAHIPYCSICAFPALFTKLDTGEYVYSLTNYCPNCGSIMNPDIANKSPEDSVKEQVDEINSLYNHLNDDLGDGPKRGEEE